jgi:hypothetical protein
MLRRCGTFESSRARRTALFLSIGLLGALGCGQAFAQGCVAARGAGQTTNHAPPSEHEAAGGTLQTSIAYRWLNSDRHFVGSEEQKQRKREGSQVINESSFVDLAFTYAFNDRYSATLTIPYASHDRSSVVRDSNRKILQRYHTQNSGLADLRLMGSMWLLEPKTHPDGNVALGLGLDLPTGKKDATDTFQVFDPATQKVVAQERTVDQSIQLGDGGYGVLIDLYAYRHLLDRLSVFVNGFYAITPQETSGVPTFRRNPFESEMSIADSFMARAGFDYLLLPQHNLSISFGARVEGVPVEDLVGGSDGFRRPGYAVSVEPAITANVGSYTLNLSAPYAVYRNRTRSVADRRQSAATGTFEHGDAAFADYLLMFSFSKAM